MAFNEKEQALKVLHIAARLWETSGGVGESVPHLCRYLQQAGARVRVACLTGSPNPQLSRAEAAGVKVLTAEPGWRHTLWYSGDWRRKINDWILQADIVHIHGMWLYPMLSAAAGCRKLNRPFVISPRGNLQLAALRNSRWRKRVLAPVTRRLYGRAAAFHATSSLEAAAIEQRFRKNSRITVIPNGVESPDYPAAEDISQDRPQSPRTALYIGRISKEKGLSELLAAWREICPDFPGWQLVVAGPPGQGSERYAAGLRRQTENIPRLKWLPAVDPGLRDRLYRQAELFILPSYSENFGLTVAEALIAALPVITTTATPWRELPSHRIGWIVRPARQPELAAAMKTAMTMPPAELAVMGQAGRRYAVARFSWEKAATRMLALYQSVLSSR